MKYPAYFELDGKYAALIERADGGLLEMKSPNSPWIVDFMQEGLVIPFEQLPHDFQSKVKKLIRRHTCFTHP